METPTKQNTLYLPIKQVYFDQIIAGTKKDEYREITPNTYKKYLACDEQGEPFYNDELVKEEDLASLEDFEQYLWFCNDGQFPFYFRDDIKFLAMAVGYNKVRDTATVEVTDITPMIGTNPKGQELRFDFDKNDKPVLSPNGKFCMWIADFHLGKVIEKNIVSK